MFTPHEQTVWQVLQCNGMSRRRFMTYCAGLATALALPETYGATVAEALTTAKRLPVVWVNGQDCNGDIEGFIRSAKPTPTELLLDHLALNYNELIMSAAGEAAEAAKAATINAGGYVLIVEGSVPTGANGAYCTVAGRAFTDILREAAANAIAVIAVGTCASWGGIPAAKGGVTGAKSVPGFLGSGTPVVRLPGCPVNGDNIVATIVHYLTFKKLPELSAEGLPLFAYGEKVHRKCARFPAFQAGNYVKEYGDESHRNGACLLSMGCRGPQTYANCRTQRFNGSTSYPIASGAPCFGCVNDGFWDAPGGFTEGLLGRGRVNGGGGQGGGGGGGNGRGQGRGQGAGAGAGRGDNR